MKVNNGTGDWAGNSYATSGCPGTCEERLLDPNNFVVCPCLAFTHRVFTPNTECNLDHQQPKGIQETSLHWADWG